MVKENEDLAHLKEQDVYLIKGVPLLIQKHALWCGYTTLSMVLQYWGYRDLTPDEIFRHVHQITLNHEVEASRPRPRPTADSLALVTQELTDLKVRLITEKQHESLKARNLTPRDTLRTYIKNNIPCIVRTPGHFKVAIGLDKINDRYIFNDSVRGRQVEEASTFELRWATKEAFYPRDTRHLMLAIYPPRKVI